MSETAAADKPAIPQIQQLMAQRVKTMHGNTRGITWNELEALANTFAYSPVAAFEYAFNLVELAPHDNPQLTILVARAVAEDYGNRRLGGEQYKKLARLTAQPRDVRPAGVDELIYDITNRVLRRVERDMYRTCFSAADNDAIHARAGEATDFIIPFIHEHMSFAGGLPNIATYGRTDDQRMGHLLLLQECHKADPARWGAAYAQKLWEEALLPKDKRPSAKARELVGYMIDDMNRREPYAMGDALLELPLPFTDSRVQRAVNLTHILMRVEPYLQKVGFDDMNKLAMKISQRIDPYRAEAQSKRSFAHQPGMRGLFRVANRIHQHMLDAHAQRRPDYKPQRPAFDLRTVPQVTMVTHQDTPYGPRVTPQRYALLPLQQEALRVKATEHRAHLRHVGAGFRAAMLHFDTKF